MYIPPNYLHTYVPTYLHTFVPTYLYYLHTFFGIIYIPMYSTCLPTYQRAYVPIVWFITLYLSPYYLRRSGNLRSYLLAYRHTSITTYIPTYLCNFVPTYLYYLHTTNVPTYLNYIHAYLLMYLHTYLSYLGVNYM